MPIVAWQLYFFVQYHVCAEEYKGILLKKTFYLFYTAFHKQNQSFTSNYYINKKYED